MNFAAGMQIGGQDATFGGMRNRIINGDMRIDQRNAGASVTLGGGTYTVDRFIGYNNTDGVFTVQQVTDVPTASGFTKSLKFTVGTVDSSLSATQYAIIRQRVEGYNVADLGWGAAGAKSITLSFWAKSTVTGTFACAILNSAADRSFLSTYVINSANTWEYKTITIPGDTSGTWVIDNGIGIQVDWNLGVGSTYSNATSGSWLTGLYLGLTGAASTTFVGNSGATFQITGVQLEKGSAASAFEQLHYGHILALCQRYYYKQSGASNYIRLGTGFVGAGSTTTLYAMVNFPVTMRAKPTSVDWVASLGVWNGGGIASVSNVTLESGSESTTTAVAIATSTGLTAQQPYQLIGNASSTAALAFNAEL
jgi:hypothetical protein